jgi:heat shock protein HspQ
MIANEMNDKQDPATMRNEAKFGLGQLVRHRMFDYRGVVIDIDPVFMGTEAWYDQVARSRPPRDKPWYKVLVNNSELETYVAERNLETDDSEEGINHPLLGAYFDDFHNGQYVNHTWRTN